jgi:hypothetical protein
MKYFDDLIKSISPSWVTEQRTLNCLRFQPDDNNKNSFDRKKRIVAKAVFQERGVRCSNYRKSLHRKI